MKNINAGISELVEFLNISNKQHNFTNLKVLVHKNGADLLLDTSVVCRNLKTIEEIENKINSLV